MKKAKFLRSLVALGVVAACGCALTACSGEAQSSSASAAGSTGGIAATVNGTEIPEDEITELVQNARLQNGMEEDAAWGEFLVSNSMTPADIRSDFIDSRVDSILKKASYGELGLTVESSEIDSLVESMRANFDSDEAWAEALEQAGFTEESYRESIESSLYDQKLEEHFEETAEVTNDDLLESANEIAMYYDGAKRSSYILFAVDDPENTEAVEAAKTRAQAVLDQLNGGADFATLAKENSDDKATAENGGSAGWDVSNYIGEEYSAALGELEAGKISGLVESTNGIYIIKCDEVFTAPEKVTDINKQIPEGLRESINEMAKSTKVQDSYSTWLEGLKEAADIVINDIPADVPYNIDLTPYQTAAEEAETADGEDLDGDGEADGVIVEEVDESDASEDVEEEAEVELETAEKSEASAESSEASK